MCFNAVMQTVFKFTQEDIAQRLSAEPASGDKTGLR